MPNRTARQIGTHFPVKNPRVKYSAMDYIKQFDSINNLVKIEYRNEDRLRIIPWTTLDID